MPRCQIRVLITKAWGGLPGGYCVAHTLELCVKEFLDAPGIYEVLKKSQEHDYFDHTCKMKWLRHNQRCVV